MHQVQHRDPIAPSRLGQPNGRERRFWLRFRCRLHRHQGGAVRTSRYPLRDLRRRSSTTECAPYRQQGRSPSFLSAHQAANRGSLAGCSATMPVRLFSPVVEAPSGAAAVRHRSLLGTPVDQAGARCAAARSALGAKVLDGSGRQQGRFLPGIRRFCQGRQNCVSASMATSLPSASLPRSVVPRTRVMARRGRKHS